MNKVIIINLNGTAYQLEESGFDALRAYLDTASGRLGGNPDRDEIIADIEQAIAEKFRALLSVNKSVVLTREVEAVIAEMGPVEDASEGAAAGAAPGPAAAPKGAAEAAAPQGEPDRGRRRLYKIRDGSMLFGVCNGLATHLDIDVIIVRLAVLFLCFFYGFGILLYLVMAVVIPYANTPEERASASGPPPTAQDFIRRAKEGYYEGMKTFGDRRAYREWRRKFKQEMRGWRQDMRREWRQNARQWAVNWRVNWAPHPDLGLGAWVVFPILAILSFVLTLLFLGAAFSLITHGAVAGISLPPNIPLWLGLILLFVAFQMIKWPLRAMRHTVYYGGHPAFYPNPIVHMWNALVWVAVVFFLVWLVARHPVWVQQTAHDLPGQFHAAVHSFKEWWDKQ